MIRFVEINWFYKVSNKKEKKICYKLSIRHSFIEKTYVTYYEINNAINNINVSP